MPLQSTNTHMPRLRRAFNTPRRQWGIKQRTDVRPSVPCCPVQFFSSPRSEGWPHHGRTFSIYPCLLSFWLTLPRGVLSTSWCCPSRPGLVLLACVHLALFLVLSLSHAPSSKPRILEQWLLRNTNKKPTLTVLLAKLYRKQLAEVKVAGTLSE